MKHSSSWQRQSFLTRHTQKTTDQASKTMKQCENTMVSCYSSYHSSLSQFPPSRLKHRAEFSPLWAVTSNYLGSFPGKFLARKYAQGAICYRPSVSLSVCLSITRVDHKKTVEVRIMKFSPYGSPITLFFVMKISSRTSKGFSPSGSVKQGWGGENQPSSSFKCQYLENGRRYSQSYY